MILWRWLKEKWRWGGVPKLKKKRKARAKPPSPSHAPRPSPIHAHRPAWPLPQGLHSMPCSTPTRAGTRMGPCHPHHTPLHWTSVPPHPLAHGPKSGSPPRGAARRDFL
jgi:hypothetical protein